MAAGIVEPVVLICGATGEWGRALGRALQAAGAHVVGGGVDQVALMGLPVELPLSLDPADPDADPAADSDPPAADPPAQPADPADFMEVNTCIYVHIHTYIHIRTHTCIYMHVYTYTYAYMQ